MFDSLPVIIVTAKTKSAAAEIITEIIDDDATAEERPPAHESPDRVWRLANKYYSALVRLHARAEDDRSDAGAGAGPVGAHVVGLAPDELTRVAAERRLRGLARAAVNVLACDAPAVPDELLALCAQRRLEPAALQEPASGAAPAGPFAEPRGAGAVRAALHAHAWPGMRRRAAPAPPAPPALEEQEEELQEERFSRALEALGGAGALTAGLRGAERRAAAERVVAAFAAAIGLPLGDLDLGP